LPWLVAFKVAKALAVGADPRATVQDAKTIKQIVAQLALLSQGSSGKWGSLCLHCYYWIIVL
jgi:hypothetical protein